MAKSKPANLVINPDDFLETDDGRVWTPARNAEAWERSYEALAHAIAAAESKPRVILVCGIQGAGKTVWIGTQPASSSTIYFDAALPGAKHRARIVSIATQLDALIDAVWINTSLETAPARNGRRPADQTVPVAAIQSVAKKFEEPTRAEGFARVTIVGSNTSA